MDNKELIIKLLRETSRPGIDNLISFLETTDFFEAPASSKYHLAEEGGLAKHSLNVYFNLLKMSENRYSEESLKIVALLHDICKINIYKKSVKNIQNKDGKWVPTQTYIIDDDLPLSHGEKSVMIIQKFIELTEEEVLTIRWHMGGFEPKENLRYISQVFSKCDLSVLLHISDLKATYLDEEG